MSREKAKGTSFETAIVNYLKNWWPMAERRTLHGVLDKGDIAGTHPGLVWECKNQKKLELSQWLLETEQERINANAELGVLVVKRRMYGTAADQYAVVRLEDMIQLLKKAGYQ